MKLYFENSYGERRLIAQPREQTEVGLEIRRFIDKCNEGKPEDKKFRSYYCRTWKDEDGLTIYDVGSHSEFFYLED